MTPLTARLCQPVRTRNARSLEPRDNTGFLLPHNGLGGVLVTCFPEASDFHRPPAGPPNGARTALSSLGPQRLAVLSGTEVRAAVRGGQSARGEPCRTHRGPPTLHCPEPGAEGSRAMGLRCRRGKDKRRTGLAPHQLQKQETPNSPSRLSLPARLSRAGAAAAPWPRKRASPRPRTMAAAPPVSTRTRRWDCWEL